jgi:hypothetical protein
MPARVFLSAGMTALALAGLLVACDDKSPTAPTPPTSPPPRPAPAPVVLARLEVSGPATVAPGESVKFTATAFYSDGASRDVSSDATWDAGTSSVLSVTSEGVATGNERGVAIVRAAFNGRTSSKSVMVLPAGTFRLTVRVHDAHVPVPGAQVTVAAGVWGEFVQTTNFNGTVVFYGVAGDIEVRVNAPGYLEYRERLQVTDHQQLDTVPTLASPRENVAGLYTLTVGAAPECQSTLPGELTERTYVASLDQNERDLIVTLQGATFYGSGNQRKNTFRGTLHVDRMTFVIGAAYYSYYYRGFSRFPDIFDELTPSTYFAMSGSVTVTGSGSRRSGSLDGAIEVLLGPPRFDPVASCKSSGHRFELTR